MKDGVEPRRVKVAFVSPGFFQTLGRNAAMGRVFSGGPDSLSGAVLGDTIWRRQFAAAPGITGRKIMVNGTGYGVIGVMPADFAFPVQAQGVDLWLALDTSHPLLNARGARLLEAVGRLKPGVSIRSAEEDLRALTTVLAQQYPATNANVGIRLMGLSEALFGNVRTPLAVLWGAVLLVLVISCVTVANLLIAQGATRDRELAIRTALGATNLRVVRQLLTEHTLLAAVGSILGTFIGLVVCQLLVTTSPSNIPRLTAIRFDLPMALFTVGVIVVTAMLSSLVPLISLMRTDPAMALRDRSASSTRGGRHLAQRALIVGQLAVTLPLLVGAGLLIKSFWRLTAVDVGLDTTRVAAVKVALPDSYGPNKTLAFYRQIRDRLNNTPGVKHASAVSPVPLSGENVTIQITVPGSTMAGTLGIQPDPDLRIIQPGYFQTVGMRLLDGRDFEARDAISAPAVAIVNQTLLRFYLQANNALGHTILYQGKPLTIVGVVNDVRNFGAQTAPRPELYVPFEQRPTQEMAVVINMQSGPRDAFGAARGIIREIDADLPIYEERTLDDYMEANSGQQRFTMLLMTLFAGIAVFLTTIGINGVMAQFVTNRWHEIAVRMAIGASPGKLVISIVRQGMTMIATGLALGLVLAFILTRYMKALLFDVGVTDPSLFALILAALSLTAFFACYLPARRASSIDPMRVLRSDN